ncbi:MAG: type II secretion system protein [bacterium]
MKKRKGFTLVELMISLSLMGILISGIFFSFAAAYRTWKKVANKSSNLQVENIICERLARDIRSADEILTSSTSQEIQIKISSYIYAYSLVNNKVRRKKGASVSYLTSEDELKKLAFSYPAPGQAEITTDHFSFLVGVRE